MATVGIDFGARGLRVAIRRRGNATLLRHRYAAERMPFVADFSPRSPSSRESHFHINSLKRLLDFDRSFPASPQGMNSLDLAAGILAAVRSECLEGSLDSVPNCVLTVPPCFSQSQRSALRTAAVRGGFPRVKLLDDTLAALLMAGDALLDHEKILVYSWGASAFCAALYQVKGSTLRAVSLDGSRELGADEVDAAISEAILCQLAKNLPGEIPATDPQFLLRVAEEAARVQPALAAGEVGSVELTRVWGAFPPHGLASDAVRISPRVFTDSVARMTAETLKLVEKVLQASQTLTPGAVLGVGRMAALPDVEKSLRDRFRLPVIRAAEEAVAFGAALYGDRIPEEEWESAGPPLPNSEKKPPVAGEAPHTPAPPAEEAPRPDGGPQPAQRWSANFFPLLDSAQGQYEAGHLGEAIRSFDKVFLELARFSSDLYRRAARAYEQSGRLDDAATALTAAATRDPSNRLVSLDLIEVCYRQADLARSQHAYDRALPVLESGIERLRALSQDDRGYAKQFAQLRHLRGCVFFDQGRLADAESELAACVRLDPECKHYEQNLAKIRAGRKKPAAQAPPVSAARSVSRSALCPCGSGRKFKRCCGRNP